MKFYYIFYLFLLTTCYIKTECNHEKFQVVINNYLDQKNNQNASLSNQSTQHDFYNDHMQKYHEMSSNLIQFIQQNKLKCSCATLAAIYGYIAYKIHTHHQIVDNPASWCNWHNGKSLEELFEASSEKIGLELLKDIQGRYADPENPTSFIYSLVQFSKNLQIEIEKLEEQKNIYAWLQATRCSQLFFVDTTAIATIQTKLHKALFIKHIFSTWYTTYKIEKNS